MKKIIISVFLMVVLSGLVLGAETTVPSGDSVEIRASTDWNRLNSANQLVNQNPDPAEPGGYVELRFKVENIGAEYADDVVFKLITEYPFTLYTGLSSERRVGEMHMRQVGDEAYIVYYKLRIHKDAVEGNNPVKLRFSTDGGLNWIQEEFDVRIQTLDAIIAVNSVEMVPNEVAPGGVGELIINLENKADSMLKDIKVNLGVLEKDSTAASITRVELPLTPIGSTNEKMIKSIEGRGSENISFKIIADADADSEIYKLPITIEYSDNIGNNYTKLHYTSVIVGEKPDLVASIDGSEIISSGDTGEVSIKFTNKGATDIKFLYIELMQSERYEIISQPGVYVGNIDSDDYETADFSLSVKGRSKMVQLPFRLEYRDANNKMFKKDMIVNLKLYSSGAAIKYGLKESGGGFGKLVILLIVFGGVWLYYKKKKNIDLIKILIAKFRILRSKFKFKKKIDKKESPWDCS